jgi:hypothetical protein
MKRLIFLPLPKFLSRVYRNAATVMLCLSILVIFTQPSYGQRKKKERLSDLGIKTPWQQGNIKLIDGEVLSGLVRYNDNQQIVSFRKEIEDEELMRSFRPKDVLSMVLFDSITLEKRVFLCLRFNPRDKDEFAWEVDNDNIVSFFEVYYEDDNFAVVSHINALHTEKRTASSPGGVPSTSKYLVSNQLQHIFFIDDQGVFDRYITISKHSTNNARAKTSSHSQKIEILEKYLGKDWPRLSNFAKHKNQNLKTIESLKWLLTQYDILQGR